MSKELIGKIRDELSDGGVMVAPYWAELLKDSAQTLESQAREIERLTAAMQRVDDHYQAQKAQPSGVDERE